MVCNGMNDTCIIIQRGHHLVSSSRTKPANDDDNQSTDKAINEVLLGNEDALRTPVCMTGTLVPFGLETD